jgi:hypothetical protein
MTDPHQKIPSRPPFDKGGLGGFNVWVIGNLDFGNYLEFGAWDLEFSGRFSLKEQERYLQLCLPRRSD